MGYFAWLTNVLQCPLFNEHPATQASIVLNACNHIPYCMDAKQWRGVKTIFMLGDGGAKHFSVSVDHSLLGVSGDMLQKILEV